MPLFSTPTQFAVCALLFVAGWLFGLASHPGGRKWKERYLAERDAHAVNRKDADARIAAARNDTDGRVTTANQRIAELERENADLRRAAPVTAQTISPQDRIVQDRVVVPARAASAAHPAYPAGTKRSWFDFNR